MFPSICVDQYRPNLHKQNLLHHTLSNHMLHYRVWYTHITKLRAVCINMTFLMYWQSIWAIWSNTALTVLSVPMFNAFWIKKSLNSDVKIHYKISSNFLFSCYQILHHQTAARGRASWLMDPNSSHHAPAFATGYFSMRRQKFTKN